MAVPHLTTLDASPGLVAALVAGRPVGWVTLHVARILYDGLRSGCGFSCARERAEGAHVGSSAVS